MNDTGVGDGRDDPPARTEHIGYLLNRVAAAIHARASEALAELAIAPREFGVMRTIADGGPQSQKDVGECRGIDRTSVVEIVDKLERQGLVVRGQDPRDRRCHLLALTDEGAAVLVRARVIAREVEEAYLHPLHEEDRRHLRRILTILHQTKETGAR